MSDDRTIGEENGASAAAEYVLGVLSAQERRDFALRLRQEPKLAAEVEFWERRLGVLASEVRPVMPPPQVWSGIETALGSGHSPATSPAGFWQSLPFWRWTALASAAVAVASLVALVTVGRVTAPGNPLVAKLDLSSGGQAGFVAAVDPLRGGLTIVPASVSNVNQRVLELWLIAPGGKPRSLGLIEASRPKHIELPADLIGHIADATLAVSLEPPGGSPTAQPTGPGIAGGKLTKL
jgi:anti-sigma-K factor RskA